MYEQFFGLVDEPFRLTPDPHYLYLSPKHAEALAHLRLALSESSGFVCITGDVGTGKTTLLRTFLGELGPNVSAAYTLVPPLSALELLRRICREFGVTATDDSQGALVEALHAHLLAAQHAGRVWVVVLDEAQALSVELLEQIRLLLNLETETHKLLRIVLVGQPQLRKLLLDPALAQLNQRITLRWHLGPLSSRETAAYVAHRLSVASGGRAVGLFTQPAVRLLHSVSGGVPRLVNMVAHRALLAAFVARQTRVTRRFVVRAYKEIQSVPLPGTLSTAWKAAYAAVGLAAGVSFVTFGGAGFDRWRSVSGVAAPAASAPVAPPAARATVGVAAPDAAPVAAVPPVVVPTAAAPAVAPLPPAAEPAAVSAAELARRLADESVDGSAQSAATAVLAAWGEPGSATDGVRLPDALEEIAWRRGLQGIALAGNLSMVRLLDLPAMVTLRVPGVPGLRYAALLGVAPSHVSLVVGGTACRVDAATFEHFWTGQARVLWRDFEALGAPLQPGARGVAVVHLQQLLQRIGALDGALSGVYDGATQRAVVEFQRAHQLDADGVVGPLTRIVLYGVAGAYQRPSLGSGARATS